MFFVSVANPDEDAVGVTIPVTVGVFGPMHAGRVINKEFII
jgi:hypothetical protein